MPSLSLSWIALKGLPKDSILSRLGLVEVAPEVEPFYHKHEVVELPSGWVIILATDFNYPAPARMAAVSIGGTCLACSIDERVMYSVARLYEDGKAVWSVDHNGGEKGLYHLEVAGDPPPELAEIRARITAEQDAEGGDAADVDLIFDVPAELSKALCGYRYGSDDEGPRFTALNEIRVKGRSWLGKLFGGK
jgi:hypothetical protein